MLLQSDCNDYASTLTIFPRFSDLRKSHILMIVIAELVNIYPSGNASDIILYKDTLESKIRSL